MIWKFYAVGAAALWVIAFIELGEPSSAVYGVIAAGLTLAAGSEWDSA